MLARETVAHCPCAISVPLGSPGAFPWHFNLLYDGVRYVHPMRECLEMLRQLLLQLGL